MRYGFKLDGRTHYVQLEEHAEGPRFLVEGTSFQPEVERLGPSHYRATLEGDSFEFRIEDGNFLLDRTVLDLEIRRAKPELVRAGGAGRRKDGKIKPPMPGKIVEVRVKEGDPVEEGAIILVLEAMKMQNDLKSPMTGTVSRVHVTTGANVEATTVMVEIEPNVENAA